MTVVTWIKVIVIAAALWLAFYLGTLKETAALEKDHADMAEATTKALLAEQAKSATELDRVNQIVRKYEAQPIDPVVAGVARRLFKYTIQDCPMSAAGRDASGAAAASGVPGGNPEVERLTQQAFDAGARDSARLELCKATWPR